MGICRLVVFKVDLLEIYIYIYTLCKKEHTDKQKTPSFVSFSGFCLPPLHLTLLSFHLFLKSSCYSGLCCYECETMHFSFYILILNQHSLLINIINEVWWKTCTWHFAVLSSNCGTRVLSHGCFLSRPERRKRLLLWFILYKFPACSSLFNRFLSHSPACSFRFSRQNEKNL